MGFGFGILVCWVCMSLILASSKAIDEAYVPDKKVEKRQSCKKN